jgi:pimeloyl-ACP methyl ester carboxylesterase
VTEFVEAEGRRVAVLRRSGGNPGLFWLGGFRSDMVGAKAGAIDALGERRGLAVTRFDYSGHGQSGGDYRDGTISQWLMEAQAVFATTSGPQVVIGSSMGGWIALLLARALRETGAPRIKALVLIAPAVDMTEDLMRAQFKKKQLKALETEGFVLEPNDYGDPHTITRALIEDGTKHLMFGRPIETGCPVTILQGGKDADVPKAHALKLVNHILSDPVSFTLIPDGDHRLSREEDLRVLEAAVVRAVEAAD